MLISGLTCRGMPWTQVDCVENQPFCAKNMIRAYPTVRMYKDGDPTNFELFTGARAVPSLIEFIQDQMHKYKNAHHMLEKVPHSNETLEHILRPTLVGLPRSPPLSRASPFPFPRTRLA